MSLNLNIKTQLAILLILHREYVSNILYLELLDINYKNIVFLGIYELNNIECEVCDVNTC